MQKTIYIDLRCLQDENYRVRGIGQHVAGLLRARARSSFSSYKAIGLVDPGLPPLLPAFRPLVDQITSSTNPCLGNTSVSVFLDGSPMGHDARFTARLLNHQRCVRAAVLLDFIPLDWPGYLPTVNSRIAYVAKLARLKKFDVFFPISNYTARRASELLGIPTDRMVITGAAVRSDLYTHRKQVQDRGQETPYFFTIFGGDIRKNIDVVVTAVRQLNLAHKRRIPLKVAGHYDLKSSGHYDEACRRKLLHLAGHEEGEGFLEFCPAVSDQELADLYAGSIATIVPSHIEGFSLPVIEAAVCGSPVIVSTCAAHLELIDREEALFPSNDVAALGARLDALLKHPELRECLRKSQAHLGQKFHENAVGSRLWTGLQAAVEKRTTAVNSARLTRPTLAFISPWPPDASEGGLCAAMAINAGAHLFASDLYTDAPRPLSWKGAFRDCGPINIAPHFSGKYEGIVSVLGGSPEHSRINDVFMRCGGPCLIYEFPSSPLASVAGRAAPLLVHSRLQQEHIRDHFQVEAVLLPCCPANTFQDEDLTDFCRKGARERCGIHQGVFAICMFGDLARGHRLTMILAALDLLRSWRIPAELHLVGRLNVLRKDVDALADLFGIRANVHCHPVRSGTAEYRQFLIASDVAVQLPADTFGEPSMALADCISAGLPAVATWNTARACDAPMYVSTLPDRYSPLQLAEQLASIWDSPPDRASFREARLTYLEAHNFALYSKRLLQALELA